MGLYRVCRLLVRRFILWVFEPTLLRDSGDGIELNTILSKNENKTESWRQETRSTTLPILDEGVFSPDLGYLNIKLIKIE